MLKIEKKQKLPVEIDGVVYELISPTFGQAEALQKKLEETPKEKSLPIMKQHIIDLGLPEAVVSELSMDAFLKIIEYVSGKKN